MNPSLIVTVDTEEEGLWTGTFKARGNTVRNVEGVPRFQAVCERFGVLPTYLVDTPVVDDDRSVDVLREIQDSGRGEIGAHLHPWCAPPLTETTNARESYLCNLPESLQREKLRGLTDAIERRFGRRPTSFRAGRYGLDIVGARILEELGYIADSSVIAYSSFSDEGGPDFQSAPCVPYGVGGDDLRVPCPNGRLLEVPVTVGYNRRDFAAAQRVQRFAARAWCRPLRLVGVLDRLNVVRRIKFSPEQANAPRMTRLVDVYLARRAPCMVMMLHSSSLVAGGSPYVPDARRLETLLADLEATLAYCTERRGMIGHTLSGFARSYNTNPLHRVAS
jgi:hypothetical protein